MNENNIEMIVDKKNILLANSKFDLTEKILKLLDKELKSIKLELSSNVRYIFFCS